jgi:hypothetical protein
MRRMAYHESGPDATEAMSLMRSRGSYGEVGQRVEIRCIGSQIAQDCRSG